MPAFPPIPLGQRIPDSPHAVSCSLPTMRDVRGYEEKDPEITRHLTSGYPRFVVHPFARQLAEHFIKRYELYGQTLWLTSSEKMAHALVEHLNQAAQAFEVRPDGALRVAKSFSSTRHPWGSRVCGVLHNESPELSRLAKHFLQHLGGFLSSREAEDHLVWFGLRAERSTEETLLGEADTSPGEANQAAKDEVFRQLQGAIGNASFVLTNCGMSAIYAAFRAVSDLQAKRGRTIWIQLGWLYLDTIAILQKFTSVPSANYVYIRDVFDLRSLERIFAAHGKHIAGVIAEVPTNPLIQTPDLPALAALCRHHGARLLVDPSISSAWNLDVLPHADVIVTSLTKYTASEGDVLAGLAAVNPTGPDAKVLFRQIADEAEAPYHRDLARLAWQIGRTGAVLAQIHAGTARVVKFLEAHPAIREVHWALSPASRENYLRLARAPDATGGMITFTLREIGGLEKFYDRLRLPKGPSFGMTTTLICPFMYLAHYDLVTTPAGLAELAASKLDPDLLRLCVGTEPPDEIIAALAEALE